MECTEIALEADHQKNLQGTGKKFKYAVSSTLLTNIDNNKDNLENIHTAINIDKDNLKNIDFNNDSDISKVSKRATNCVFCSKNT